MASKAERVEHANALILTISSHGRRFFFNKQHDRVACFKLDERGRVWFVDDWSDKPIYVHSKGRWSGFSHGGMLRSLVEDMRDYIVKGEPVARWKIAIKQLGDPTQNVWGYDEAAAIATREQAFALPIMEQTS